MACNEATVSAPFIDRITSAMSLCASVVARISTIAWYWTNGGSIATFALTEEMNEMTSTTCLGRRTHHEHIFLRVMTS